MTWHTDPPKREGEYLILDSWHKREVAHYRTDLGWCVRGHWVGHDRALCWMDVNDLPVIPAHLMRERW